MQEKLDEHFLSDEEKIIQLLTDEKRITLSFAESIFDNRVQIEKKFGISYERAWLALVSLRKKKICYYVVSYKTRTVSFVLNRKFVKWQGEQEVILV